MRLLEIASAEEQIALFKLVTDKVWQALADQKQQQAAQQKLAAAKRSSRKRRRASPKPFKPVPFVKPPTPTPTQPNTQATAEPAAKSQTQPTAPNTNMPVQAAATSTLKQPQTAATASSGNLGAGTAELMRIKRLAASKPLR